MSALLLIFCLPALACNLPTAQQGLPAAQQGNVEDAVSQTLTALPPGSLPPGALPPLAQTALPDGQGAAPTAAPPPGGPAPEESAATSAPQAVPVPGSEAAYVTQPGDTLAALALRFEVEINEIGGAPNQPPGALLASGQALNIPYRVNQPTRADLLLPDVEIVYSPALVGFSTADFIQQAGGFLSAYTEEVDGETLTGAQIVDRVALETSTSPRLLLAILEYRAGWVFGSPREPEQTSFPIGFYANGFSGLHKELTLTARQLTIGYYGWRSGKVLEVEHASKERQRMAPNINAGTAALLYLFAKLYGPQDWEAELYSPDRFLAFYRDRFGDPWQRAASVGPVMPDVLEQPQLELPFLVGERWSLTGGPHNAWGIGSPWGGVDFAPSAVEKGCTVSRYWATASAPGLVLRSENGMVVLDLDGDGQEQTGWVLLYLHVAEKERAQVGAWLNTDDPIGHPSCEGGFSTGTHVHLARKYNGEWLAADGPAPLVLSGFQAWTGEKPYSGTLVRGETIVTARPDGSHTSLIVR